MTGRYLSLRRDPERGTVSVTMEVSLEDGELLEKALDVARDSLSKEDAERAGESFSAQQADALVAMARAYLEGGPTADRTRPKPLREGF